MDQAPTVSIIIPAYNRAHTLARAMRSVQAQTYTDWECLVVDDASTDGTKVVACAFADARIRYLRHAFNKGVGAARNTGIRAARGRYLAFLDSDDEWLPEKLERQIAVFEASDLSELGLVVSGEKVITPNGESEIAPFSRGWASEDFLTGNVSLIHTWLMKRDVCSGVGLFDESMRRMQDMDYVVRITRRYMVDFVPELLAIVHKEEDTDLRESIADSEGSVSGRARFLEKHGEALARHPGRFARHVLAVAQGYYQLGDMAKARRSIRRAVMQAPGNARLYPWFAAALLGERGYDLALRASKMRRRGMT